MEEVTALEVAPPREFDDPFEVVEDEVPRPRVLIPITLETQATVEEKREKPLSSAKAKAEMLDRWQRAVELASVRAEKLTDPAEYMAHQQAKAQCVAYLAEAIEVLRKKSAAVGGGPQAVSTPRPFFEFVAHHLGIHFGIDLAAVGENTLCPEYFGPCGGSLAMDSLTEDWVAVTGPGRWGWLNPPYANVLPWVRKARLESARGARIVMLVRLSPGTKWWAEEVDGQPCQVLKMKGRMKFPSYDHGSNFDTAVIAFDGQPFREHTWDWRAEMKAAGFEA